MWSRNNLIRTWKGALEPSTVVSDVAVTNYAEKSEDLASFRWSKIRTTVGVSTESVVHNGKTIPLVPFIEDGTAGLSHYLHNTIGNTNAVGHSMVISVYAKAAARTWLRIGQNTVPSAYTYFDLINGVIGSSLAGVDAAYIEEITPGIYRLEVVFTATGVVSDHTIQVSVADNDNTFDGLNQTSLLVGGFQIEQGLRAGPYVATEDVQYTGFPITERFLSYGAPDVETVTNVVGYSHTVENWFQKTNVTVVDNKESINGIPLALITDDGTLGAHWAGQVNQYTANSTRRRLSIYVKMGTARYVTFSDRASSSTNTQWNNIFDLQDGVWTFKGTLYIGLHEEEYLGEGMWRISFVSAVNSGAYDSLNVGISNGPTKEDTSYSGVGLYLYAGGAQVEYDTDASPGTLVRHDSAGTSGGQATRTFGLQIGTWKGAVEPWAVGDFWGPAENDLIGIYAPNQEITASIVGSTTIGLDGSMPAVVLDSMDIIKTGVPNSETVVTVELD